jgi:4-amino-4-deoxy-L-arabinose transferase-like glycosyltransferase
MPFSGMLTIAMVSAAVTLGLTRNENTPFLPRTPWLALILFGVFLGLAVLAKGPAAIILSGGAIFFWALSTKRWRDAFRLFHPAALVSFCLTALPWYILCARRNPDFLRIFLIEHNFRRYLTSEFQHVQPFWYYVPVILIAFLPWTAALVWSLVSGLFHSLRGKTISFRSVFFLAWALFCITFFTLSKSKLPGYALPGVPAVGLLMARCCASLATQHRKSLGVSLFGFGCVLMGLVALTDTLHLHFNFAGTLMMDIIESVVLLMALTNVMMGGGFSWAQDVRVRRALTSLSIIPILLVIAFVWRLSPEFLLDQFSARGLASEIVLRQVPVGKIEIDRGVQRAKRYALDFYLRTELKEWDQNPIKDAYVLSGANRCRNLQSKGFQCREVNLGIHALGWYLSRIVPTDSANRLPHGGQPQ